MAEFSKSGKTVYFNGKALKSSSGQGISGNHYDLENGDEYWISGVKKDQNDRHWAGGGKVMIDEKVVDKYLKVINKKELNLRFFEATHILPTDKQKFAKLENEKLDI